MQGKLNLLGMAAAIIGGGSQIPAHPFGPVAAKMPPQGLQAVPGRQPDPSGPPAEKIPAPDEQGQDGPVMTPQERQKLDDLFEDKPAEKGDGLTRKQRRMNEKYKRFVGNRQKDFGRMVEGFKKDVDEARKNAKAQDDSLLNALADHPDLVKKIQDTFKTLVIRHPEWSRNKLMQVAAGRHGVVVSYKANGTIGR